MSEIERAMAKRWGQSREDRVPTQITVNNSAGNVSHGRQEDPNSRKPSISAHQSRVARKEASRYLELTPARLEAAGIGTSDPAGHQTAEEYRIIKQPILKNAFGHGAVPAEHANLVMLTSAVEGEGKTFTSINLAISIARELDHRVLLVDADVSRSGISNVLGFKAGKGLTDVLADDGLDLGEILIKTNEPKLTLLSAGQGRPNVTELLASENMRDLVRELATRYADRVIIFDSPPLLATSEARVLAGLMGQVLVVVEAGRTSRPIVEESISYLDSSKIIGLVLNKSRQMSGQSYYGYGYGLMK